MAADKLVDSSQLDGAMTATANAIRSKTGSESDISWNLSTGFASAISDITSIEDIGAGTITNNTSGGQSSGTINRGAQIKIGSGYYLSDTYYQAEANSGTLSITQAGTISVDGYENVSVPSLTPTFRWTGANYTMLLMGFNSDLTTSTTDDNNNGLNIKATAGYRHAKLVYDGRNLGFLSKYNGDEAMAAATETTTWSSVNYFLTGVTLTTPSSGTKSFSVTVPNGDTTATFVFNVDTSGNVTITES